MPVKPTASEDEYFARQEAERRRRAAEERQSKLREEERQRVLSVAGHVNDFPDEGPGQLLRHRAPRVELESNQAQPSDSQARNEAGA